MITIVVLFSATSAVLIALALALMRRGIAREDADQSLRTAPPNRTCAITRRMTGLYADPQNHGHPPGIPTSQNSDNAPTQEPEGG